jgi:hypothetical protein
MIPVDFFRCRRDQIVTCSWDEACDRFPFASITIPDASALTSLGEALTGSRVFSPEPVPLSTEPFYELSDDFLIVVRDASADDLKDAGARWAQLLPWPSLFGAIADVRHRSSGAWKPDFVCSWHRVAVGASAA